MRDRMRVELHPATDHWMKGDRFGEIVSMPGKPVRCDSRVLVKLDKSERIVSLRDADVLSAITS